MRCRNKANSMRVVLRFTVGLILGLFVLGIGNIQYVEGSSWHKGRFHKAESLTCGETITTHAVLYNDLDCSNFGGVALTLGDGADLNLHGKKIIGNESDNCIEITGDGAKVWNGTVMKCFYGIEVTGNRNEITQVEVRDNKRIGINIAGNSNKIYSSIVDNNGREGIVIDGGKGNEISRSIVDNNGRQGIHIDGGTSNKISRTVVDNNGRHGIQIDGGNSNEISRSTVRGSCRDGIEIKGNDNLVSYNQVEDNGNPETCTNFDENYNPSGYAGIDVTDDSQENEIKHNRAGCNLGCISTDDTGCVGRERDLWDENVDENGQFDSTNQWENNSITCSSVKPEASGSPPQ